MNVATIVAQICEDLEKKIPEKTVWCASNTLQILIYKNDKVSGPRLDDILSTDWNKTNFVLLADCEFAIVDDCLHVNIKRAGYPYLCSSFLLADPKCFDKVIEKILSYGN